MRTKTFYPPIWTDGYMIILEHVLQYAWRGKTSILVTSTINQVAPGYGRNEREVRPGRNSQLPTIATALLDLLNQQILALNAHSKKYHQPGSYWV